MSIGFITPVNHAYGVSLEENFMTGEGKKYMARPTFASLVVLALEGMAMASNLSRVYR
jgi:hypothetical protein